MDVIVIGGGIAGVAAALEAAAAGARVALVRRGPGATALCAGGWRGDPGARIRAALAAAGLELRPCDGPLAHVDGMLASYDFAATSHATASLAGDTDRSIVCGMAGLPGFRASALASLWSDAAGLPRGALMPVRIDLDDTPYGGWSPVALAARVGREPQLLAAAIGRAARDHGATLVILPAVLGLDDHARVYDAVEQGAGCRTAEAVGGTPSVPGWRLDRALLRALGAANVRVIDAVVTGAGASAGGELRRVSVRGPRGGDELESAAFVLATGKYIGGGIRAGAEYEEPALGCDVAAERFARTIDDPGASLMLTDPVRTEPQPVLGIGVHADDEGRPIAPGGAVTFRNVFVAGSIRAGTETAALGLGVAAADGGAAGSRAAAYASRRG